MSDQAAPLKIENLVKAYGPVKAVDGVSFAMRPGEIFGLLGPNGAGKTSIISTIVTLERPTSGSVKVFGYDVTKQSKAAKVHLGIVPQELVNTGFFTLIEILEFQSGYYGIRNNRERIDYLLHRLQLWDHRFKKVKQLSGGMKRRMMIAKALVHEPKLLLLDEPTAGVDIELRQGLWEFVTELRGQGVSVLLTTHYLEEAEELCDRVAVIHHGKLLHEGPTKDMVQQFTHRHIRFELKDLSLKIEHPYLIDSQEGVMEFRLPASMSIGDLLADLSLDLRSLSDVQIREGSLEDAFRRVLGGPA